MSSARQEKTGFVSAKNPVVGVSQPEDARPVEDDLISVGSLSASSFSNERLCRICHEGESKEDLRTHCHCKGTVSLAHTPCILRWIKKSGSVTCELCCHKYVTTSRVNKRFWQWRMPRVGTKGWFKFVFFMGFFSMLVVFTSWIIWSSTSTSSEAKQERNKRKVEYTYIVYGMLVLIAIIGIYALNLRPFVRFLSKCIVINRSMNVIPNRANVELCEETLNGDTGNHFENKKTIDSKENCSAKHGCPKLKDTYVQVTVGEGGRYDINEYTKTVQMV